jgi:hypothetical protein
MLEKNMSTLDLNLVSLYRIKGQEQPLLPGLLAQNPPKRTARGRENDRLLIYLNLAGNIPFSGEEYAQVTAKLAERFYQTSGSLTFALKSSIEALNTVLAERNMKTTGQGKYAIGVLVLAALRGDLLYIVQAGPTRVHWLGAHGVKPFYDPSLAGKGLGLSQNTRMYFAQAQLSPGDLLVMSANQPKEWEAAMQERGPGSLDSLRRRLTTVTNDSLNAVLISASEGMGEINVLRPAQVMKSELPPVAPPAVSPPPGPLPDPDEIIRSVQPAASLPLQEAESMPEPVPALPILPVSTPVSAPFPALAAQAAPITSRAARAPEVKSLLTPERRTQMVHVGRRSARWMAQAIHAARDLNQVFNEKVGKFIPRLLPAEEDEPESQNPTRWMAAFIAVAIPILVVVVAVTIYFELGRPAEFNLQYAHALEAARQTQNLTDPAELRLKWQATLFHLDEAEKYRTTSDSERLRSETQSALDALDRIKRTTYRPAFSVPLSSSLRISRMAASDFDLYLLNATENNVLRAVSNGNNYTLQDFDCKSGTYDGITVGALIDIIALPRTSPSGVTLMGMDASGNLLYCIPGQAPKAAFLTLPSADWKGFNAFAYDSGTLYVLDAKANAVWTYIGQPGQSFSEPFFFFEQEIPRLSEAIGMAANGDDLYILHRDGHLTTCTYSRISTSPTRCSDPATLVDTRPGYQGGAKLVDGLFIQIAFTLAPDPSIVMLEPNTRSIFRFSPRSLELQHQIRSQPGKDDSLSQATAITAMTFSPNKVLFVLSGGQVYFAVNAP